MNKYPLFIILACLVLFSCDNETDVNPEGAFISARVNGLQTMFTVVPEGQLNYIVIGQNYVTINLYKGGASHEVWGIEVYNFDIDKIALPYTIKGPNPDFTGGTPEFHTRIYDPSVGDFGKFIAGANSFGSEISVTIISVENDLIKGTFEGAGFENGVFQAKLTRAKL